MIRDFEPNYQILKVLGRGGEGTVYLVKDRLSKDEAVLKIFHRPLCKEQKQWHWLRAYADRVSSGVYGLSKITLLQSPDEIIGLHYPYIPLYEIHWRIFIYFEQVAQALFGAYCRAQSYLMAHYELGLIDGIVDNFVLGEDRQFHYIDYGTCIMPFSKTDPPRRGAFGYSFTLMLLSIYNVNLRLETTYLSDYSYTKPCLYSQSKSLDQLAARHVWIREIVSEIRSHDATIFLDSEFYRRLGERLPDGVSYTLPTRWLNNLLMYVKRARDLTRHRQ